MRTVFYYSVYSISQIDQRCLINEENKQVCVGSTSHGNLQEKRDFCGEKGEGIGAVVRKDAWGEPGACGYCTHMLRPWGLTRGSFRSPPVPDSQGCSLAHPTPDKSCSLSLPLLLLCFPTATVPFLPSLHFSFHFLI